LNVAGRNPDLVLQSRVQDYPAELTDFEDILAMRQVLAEDYCFTVMSGFSGYLTDIFPLLKIHFSDMLNLGH